jgi:hypothetical protein
LAAYDTSYTELGLGFQWNLDFWGKYRRATESARDQLLAANWARQEVITSLVANVASAYFTLREQDLQIQISQHTLCFRSGFASAHAVVVRPWPHLPARCAPGGSSWCSPPPAPSPASKNRSSNRKT